MRNHILKFGSIAVIGLTKRTKGSNLTFGAHKRKNSRSKGVEYFANISIYMKIQRPKFGYIAVFDLLNLSNGLDHDCGPHKLKKKKTELSFEDVQITVQNVIYPLL